DPQRPKVAKCPSEYAIALRPAEPRPRLASVAGADDRTAGDEDPVRVVRIHSNLIEGIAGLPADVISSRVHAPPRRPCIVSAVDFPANEPFSLNRRGKRDGRRFLNRVAVVDYGVQYVWIHLVQVQADAPDDTARQSAAQFLPIGSAIRCLIDSARRTTVGQPPWKPSAFVGSGVQDVRLSPVDHKVDSAGLIVYVKNLGPGVAGIGCLEYSPLLIRREQMAHCGNVHDVWIRRVNYNPGDVLRIRQPHVSPLCSAICRPVDIVTPVGAAGARCIARPYPDDLAVRGSDGDRSNRSDVLALEDRRECCAGVCGLPYTAIASCDVESVQVGLCRGLWHCDVRHPGAGAKRAQVSIREAVADDLFDDTPRFLAS